MRKNEKQNWTTTAQTISKSNELSLSHLNAGLTLQQMQLLAFAIYCTQQRATTTFAKHEFEKFFQLQKYLTKHAKEDVQKLMRLDAATIDYGARGVHMFHVFSSITYLDGKFRFNWTPDMLPHILELKERFILVDLVTTSQFTSSFSWRLYEFLKAKHGCWSWSISKDEIMQLFNVEHNTSYKNTSNFKKKVLDKAISELNTYTEFEVYYDEQKKGRQVTGFTLYWSKGQVIKTISPKQRAELQNYVYMIIQDALHVIELPPAKQREAYALVQQAKEFKQRFIDEETPIAVTDYHQHLKDLQGLLKQFQTYIQIKSSSS